MIENLTSFFLFFPLIALLLVTIFRFWKWLPVMLFPIIWYIPRQTAPGGLLENYLMLRWLTFIFIPLIIYFQFMIEVAKKKAIISTNIALPLGLFVAFSLFSGIANSIPFLEMLGGIFQYIRYPLLFVAFVNMDIPKKVSMVFYRLFLFLVIIQIPECLCRYLILNIGWDNISWSLGPYGSFDLGVYMIYATALYVASDFMKRFKWYHLLLYILFFVLALLGEIKAFIIFAPIIAIFIIFVALKQNKKRKTLAAIAATIFFITLFCLIFNLWSNVYKGEDNLLESSFQSLKGMIQGLLPFSETEREYYSYRSMDRINAFMGVWDYLKYDYRKLIFGAGPGSSLSGNFFGKPGIISNIPIFYKNQLSTVLIDSGLVGLCLYFWMLLTILMMLFKGNKTITDPDFRVISFGMIGMWVFYAILGPFYDLVWRQDSANYIFYFFAAILYKYLMDRDKSKSVSKRKDLFVTT